MRKAEKVPLRIKLTKNSNVDYATTLEINETIHMKLFFVCYYFGRGKGLKKERN